MTEISEYLPDDYFDKDTTNIFSEPESEWQGAFKIDEPEDDQNIDLRPESDQSSITEQLKINCKNTPSFSYEGL